MLKYKQAQLRNNLLVSEQLLKASVRIIFKSFVHYYSSFDLMFKGRANSSSLSAIYRCKIIEACVFLLEKTSVLLFFEDLLWLHSYFYQIVILADVYSQDVNGGSWECKKQNKTKLLCDSWRSQKINN